MCSTLKEPGSVSILWLQGKDNSLKLSQVIKSCWGWWGGILYEYKCTVIQEKSNNPSRTRSRAGLQNLHLQPRHEVYKYSQTCYWYCITMCDEIILFSDFMDTVHWYVTNISLAFFYPLTNFLIFFSFHLHTFSYVSP